MKHSERTNRDLVYIDTLEREGPLSVSQLAELAKQNYLFRDVELVAIEQDVKRFAKHYETIRILEKRTGKLHWRPSQSTVAQSNQLARNTPAVLSSEGFLTSKAVVKCEHCGQPIDLTQVEMRWRPKSRVLAMMLHVHHFFRVTCPKCGWVGRYDTGKDVKSLLPGP